jgi:Co/Zn/Cd efflux system component
MWAGIVGFFLPQVIAVVQQPGWSNALRSIITFMASIVAAIGTVLIQNNGWSWHDWVSSTLLILVTAIATYHGLWKPTKIAPKIEAKTSSDANTL